MNIENQSALPPTSHRFQAQVREACLRLLKIPILGALLALLFIYVLSNDWLSAVCFSVLICLLLYLPLIGLLYFESKNWVALEPQGLRLSIDQSEQFLSWPEIAQVKISHDSIRISHHNGEDYYVIHYLAEADKAQIYATFFEQVGLKPNQDQYLDEHPNYLNWDKETRD